MSKTNETGHARNVANFSELCLCVNSLGKAYNPTRELIKPAALLTLLENAENVLSDYSEALSPYRMAVAEREIAFEPVNKLVTRVLNALKATDTSSRIDETAQSLARKIKGERASGQTPAPAPSDVNTENETKQISAAQTSYDNRFENLSKLVVHLQNIPQYTPNETDLQINSLQNLLNDLKQKNNRVKEATISLDNARIARDKVLYLPITGLTDIAFDTKVYVKSVFGATSAEFRQISGIEFKSGK